MSRVDKTTTPVPYAGEPMFSIEDLASTGLLWLINETVFWPRGYSIGIATHTFEDGHKTPLWTLYGDGSEPWQASSEGVATKRFKAAEKFFAETKKRNS